MQTLTIPVSLGSPPASSTPRGHQALPGCPSQHLGLEASCSQSAEAVTGLPVSDSHLSENTLLYCLMFNMIFPYILFTF